MKSWYAIQIKRRKEQAVTSALDRLGLETYCPIIWQWGRKGGRRIRKECPLFPGYLFARLHFVEDYSKIRWTPGLVRIVTSGGEPIEIREETLKTIKELEQCKTLGRLRSMKLLPGTRVRLVEGPFKGFEGRVMMRLSSGERIRVLLELFRRQAALDCDPEFLQPIAAAAS